MKLALHQGSYQARSPIANAQACINLYPETNPPDAPFPVTHYPAPGLDLLSDFSGTFSGHVRGLYVASDGTAYAVIGQTVIRYLGAGNTSSSYYVLGTLVQATNEPISMCDNGVTLVIVDVNTGYTVTLPGAPGGLTQITDSAFYGSQRVDYIDTFMVFNQPGTGNFYTTTSGVVTPFDPTYVAAKEGWNDRLVCCACLHDNIWLFGNTTTEIWFNAGGSTFPFARMPNTVIQQGTVSAWAPVIADNAVYWISQDRWGRNICMRGEGYSAKRISTFAVEYEWNKYPTMTDAIGMVYQLAGHEVIGWYFAYGNAWWAYDATTQMWHQRTYNGLSDAWLPYCMAGWGSVSFVTGNPNQTLVGSRLGPQIYNLEARYYTDAGVPITRQRSWMHTQEDGQRIHHSRFSASFAGAQLSPDTLQLDWSDDAGQTYGTAVPQTIHNQTNGQYQWRRLGYARDRVYRLTWQGQGECALNGAYIDVIPHGT